MKRIILKLLIILSLLKFTVAQVYYTIPDSSIIWETYFLSGNFDYIYHGTKPFKDDTLFNNLNYTKLYNIDSNNVMYLYAGAFRSDSTGKTYFIPKDSISEFILFDFSKNAGDTIYQVLGKALNYFITSDYYVDSTYYINVDNLQFKVLYLHAISAASCFTDYLVCVERIGSLGGGIYNMKCFGCTFSYALSCVSINDTSYVPNQCNPTTVPINFTVSSGNCLLTSVYSESTRSRLKIFPNPYFNNFIINSNSNTRIKEIRLMDILGKAYLPDFEILNEFSVEIKEDKLPAGIYFLQILDGANNISSFKLIKQ